MRNIENIEVIQLNTVDGKLVATISYQDTTVMNEVDDLDLKSFNNGYDTIIVPVNIRALQVSSRNGILVDQSVRELTEVASS